MSLMVDKARQALLELNQSFWSGELRGRSFYDQLAQQGCDYKNSVVVKIIPAAALVLENRAIGRRGEPTLARAYELVLEEWRAGDRDRELGLHIAFLAWYLLVEPGFLTGLDELRIPTSSLRQVFRDVHEFFDPLRSGDPELLCVFGLMAHLFPWVLGDVKEWEARATEYRLAYRRLAPSGLQPEVFAGRGFYGHYFKGQAATTGGY